MITNAVGSKLGVIAPLTVAAVTAGSAGVALAPILSVPCDRVLVPAPLNNEPTQGIGGLTCEVYTSCPGGTQCLTQIDGGLSLCGPKTFVLVTCQIISNGTPILDQDGNIVSCTGGAVLGNSPIQNNAPQYNSPIACR